MSARLIVEYRLVNQQKPPDHPFDPNPDPTPDPGNPDPGFPDPNPLEPLEPKEPWPR